MQYNDFINSKKITIPDTGFEPGKLNKMLFDFQRDITLWAIRKGRACIFADCGLGKTPIQLEWADKVSKHEKKPVIIFAPLAVSKQTKREGIKFGVEVNIIESQSDIKKGINITNYEKLHKFDLNSFCGVVLDESSILKSFTGKFRTEIINKTGQMKYKLACTATPAPNDYMELGNHSEFIGAMKRDQMLPMFFIHDGSDTSKWRLKGHAQNDFWKWVSEWAVMIRKPSDLGYEDKDFILPHMAISQHIMHSSEPLEGEFFVREAQTLSERRYARKSTIELRIKKAIEIIGKSKDPWLVWCNLNDESKAVGKMIDGFIEVTGSDKDDDKENRMIGFANGEIKRLVSKPRIAGFGMNWQNCNNIIFLGISDSYEQYYQAVRRCWRFGQKKPVNVHIIISEKSQSVLRNVLEKEKDAIAMAKNMTANMADITKIKLKKGNDKMDDYNSEIYETDDYTIVKGDSVEETKKIPDESIDFSIFSPPFASLYTYSDNIRDMGNSKDYIEFGIHFKYLIKELYRVMLTGRNVAVHCMNLPLTKQFTGEIQIRDFRGDIIRWFTDEGFLYHAEVCIWKDPVVAMQRTKALGLLWKQLKKDSVMSRMGIPDYVCVFRKPGDNKKPIKHTPEDYPVDKWQKIASPIWTDINQSDTLNRTAARCEDDERHICPLQLEVIERMIELYSNPGDIVFTPFAGIGSELYQALIMNRRAKGIDLKSEYYKQSILNCEIAINKKREQMLFV